MHGPNALADGRWFGATKRVFLGELLVSPEE